MDKVVALLHSSWRAAQSYRLRLLFSIGALAFGVIPIWYVASAMQGLMASHIQGEGRQYFGFLIVGLAVYGLLTTAVTALPTAIASGIGSGSLEALLTTRVRQPELITGLISYDLCWALAKATVVVGTGVALGAHLAWGSMLAALPILILIVLSYIPFGLLSSALMLAFRTTGPLPQIVLWISGLLGGVYFPTKVVPELARSVSSVVPLTYGLRALRGVMLEGKSLGRVLPDLAQLVLMTLVLFVVCALAYAIAMRHVRRAGSLSQY